MAGRAGGAAAVPAPRLAAVLFAERAEASDADFPSPATPPAPLRLNPAPEAVQ
jgi:hypothetical protein